MERALIITTMYMRFEVRGTKYWYLVPRICTIAVQIHRYYVLCTCMHCVISPVPVVTDGNVDLLLCTGCEVREVHSTMYEVPRTYVHSLAPDPAPDPAPAPASPQSQQATAS